MLEVIAGVGGAGGSGPGGGDGGTGAARYTYSSVKELAADVVPLIPTARGSFSKGNNTAGVFPDLGAGILSLIHI